MITWGTEWHVKTEYRYISQKVFLVAGSDEGAVIEVVVDGKKHSDVEITTETLYRLIEAESSGEHTLEIVVKSGTIKAFAFTFG